MQGVSKKASQIFQQTCALLWKNFLLVWRMKSKSFQASVATMIMYSWAREFPYKFLGRLDDPAFNATGVTLMFTPGTNTTRRIMGKVASNSMKTNHPVWKEMKSLTGVHLKSSKVKLLFKLDYTWFVMCAILCYCPYMYFLSLKVLKEKKRMKILMRAMGLHDIAYWFSWSLLYIPFISITAVLLTVVTQSEAFYHHSFSELYFFYFFYGVASIHLTFLLNSLLKQPNISIFVGFLLHILFGTLGVLTLFEKLPRALEWILNLFSPFAFTAGLATVQLYPFYNLYLVLSLDSVLYFLLAIYFDKVLPGKYGVPHPPAFFLRPSYWLKGSIGNVGVRADINHDPVLGSDAEPMPPGFDGKEAIRLNNIKKIYKKNNKSTEALKGVSLTVYEGQITALLGPSGSGKTALLHVLSGFAKPSAGSATIYNYNASEVWNMEGMQARIGICPQLNLHFEALTVKENLRIFAHIKGIQWKEVDQEVLLLDEPTAGLDPCSRHLVWSLLRERRAGRVTLFTTQSMDEADAQAGEPKLEPGVAKEGFLGRTPVWVPPWHRQMHINELCDPELVSSVVRQYIPDAMLKGHRRDELSFMLPLENTQSFPGLFSHLESSFLQGVVHYEVTRATLADVFLKLQGEEAIDPEAGDGDLEEREQDLGVFSKQGILTMSGMMLWRQQVCAVMRIRLLKLKHEGKILRAVEINTPEKGEFFKGGDINFEGDLISQGDEGVSFFHLQSRQYTVMCSPEPVNCFPVLVNILSNTFLRLLNSSASFRVWTKLFYTVSITGVPKGMGNMLGEKIPELRVVTLPFPFFVLLQLQARSQLRLAGLFPSAYWCGQALVDVPLFWTLMSLMFGILLLVSRTCPLKIICIFGYGISLVLLVYLIAFKFRMGRSNRYFWSLFFILVTHVEGRDIFNKVIILMLLLQENDPYIHCVIFIFLLRCLELRYGEAVLGFDPIFRYEPPEVQAERDRVRCAMASLQQDEVNPKQSACLRKEYEVKVATSICKKRKKLAVKNLSFAVKKGEVLGLLGPNGAGKSTAINMISGAVAVTAGEVLLQSRGVAGPCPGSLGWCPQQDPLWPQLTVLQHLETFAAVRGMREEDAALAISCLGKALDLLKHFKSPARSLSAGEARMLSFALSILGHPAVMVWDEPSMSVDPKGQRRMWKIIQASMKSKERAALLCTQSLEEAVAMCDRVAILVAGRLRRCSSAAQHQIHFFYYFFRTSALLTYKIPVADALPLSRSFSKLEAAKRNFKLEEYSLSLNTLHQVFVDLTRDAEEHDLEVASNGAVEQRPLQP
uniref:ABC transporter domain-containing protein n=1 Tax=Malurus cyaneus samueli TaxID=2593467 RepID=A0A8C5T9D9_9PASS